MQSPELTLLVVSAFTFFMALLIHAIGIPLADRFGLLDIPSPRRRHRKPTPINGGVCIFTAWSLGVLIYCAFYPEWLRANATSLLAMGSSLVILIGLGLIDDIRGLRPLAKFIFQILAAVIVLAFEPKIHGICVMWQSVFSYAIWPLAAIWIVGITNAVNLVDGLDGLAGGTSVLVSCSVLVLSAWGGESGSTSVATVAMALLIPATLAFLRFNWAPAKIFLGDNGSLPLGFLIATMSLICRPASHSWIMIASVVLMMGYPIIDMGLAVWRRYCSGLPLFKADRYHLHFRVRRLGLSTRQTAVLLLSIGLYLQITAICINLLPPAAAAFGMAIVTFSVFTLLFVVKCVELEMIRRLALPATAFAASSSLARPVHTRPYAPFVVTVELAPLFEVALLEEESRYPDLVHSLETLLKTITSKNDEIILENRQISIIMDSTNRDSAWELEISQRYRSKIEDFCSLVDLQCSLSGLPVTCGRRKAA